MEWTLFKADANRKKWSIRGTLYNGVDVKIPGHRDKSIAEEMRRNIEKLNRAKANNDLPPPEILPWLDNLPEKLIDKLVKHGLVERGRLERRLPLESFLDAYRAHLKANAKKARSRHSQAMFLMLRRLFKAIDGLNTINDLKIDGVKKAVKEMKVLTRDRIGEPLSSKTVREYYCAAKDFCKWMIDEGRITVNPLDKLVLPSAKEDRLHNRRPMSYEDFNNLLESLYTAKPNPHQKVLRSGFDRAMLYYTAARTGLRKYELSMLTRGSFNFEVVPATLTVTGNVSKNGHTETVPIDADFAKTMKEYTLRHMPDAKVFRLPKGLDFVTKAFHRDLENAGLSRRHANGDVVDFHTLRSTAICWWLRAGLNLLEVQHRARLRTLELIQEYVRRYVPDYRTFVTNAPPIAMPRMPDTRTG